MEREFVWHMTGPASEFATVPLDPETEFDGCPRYLGRVAWSCALRLPFPEGMAATGIRDMRFTRRPGEPTDHAQQAGEWTDTPGKVTILGTAIVTYA